MGEEGRGSCPRPSALPGPLFPPIDLLCSHRAPPPQLSLCGQGLVTLPDPRWRAAFDIIPRSCTRLPRIRQRAPGEPVSPPDTANFSEFLVQQCRTLSICL